MQKVIQQISGLLQRKPELKKEEAFAFERFGLWRVLFDDLADIGISLKDFLAYRRRESAKQENQGRHLPLPEYAEKYFELKGMDCLLKRGRKDRGFIISPLILAALIEIDESDEGIYQNKPMAIREIDRFRIERGFLFYNGNCVDNWRRCNKKQTCAIFRYCLDKKLDPAFSFIFKDMFEQYAPELLTGN